jgi:hypothetical protein
MDSDLPLEESPGSDKASQTDESVSAGTLSDVATDKDELGFMVYAQAIATFLLSDETKPPLTLSIEGEWGSGKTSFMKQLEKSLEEQAAKEGKARPVIFWFDGWRSDKDEAVWASFALQFLKHLTKGRDFARNALGAIKLEIQRFDKSAAVFASAKAAGLWLLFAIVFAFTIAALNGLLDVPRIGFVIGGLVMLGSALAAFYQTRKLVDPVAATLSLTRYVEAPNYATRRSFSDVFAEGFLRVPRLRNIVC